MVFSSLLFLFLFLPAVLLVYYVSPKQIRNLILFLFSLVFYAWGEPVYVVLMLFSTLVDYTHGMWIDKFKKAGNLRVAKGLVASSMIINLCLLGFFKYSDFLINTINNIFGVSIPLLNLALPIGISFYTFQTMSYSIDVYRGDAEVQKNIISFGTYVVLFPQLIAGPIVQYKTIAKQLDNRKETFDSFSYGIKRFMIGLGKKVLFANNIGFLWDQISALPAGDLTVVTSWIGAIAFAFQIYFDFSGYSDMAIGLGQMFGFRFLENFNYPYQSKSITEFWRRWHISLGTWFREYVYIPLGGNRRGLPLQIRNIIIVWLLTGFWHGASWNFVLWGVYFGLLLMLEKLFLLKFLQKIPAFFSHLYTILLVLFSWVIFAFEDFDKIGVYFSAMFGLNGAGFADNRSLYLLFSYGLLMLILAVASTDFPKRIANRFLGFLDSCRKAKWVPVILQNAVFLGILVVSVSFLVSDSYNPFLYFRF